MTHSSTPEQFDTVVIGAGQAGLATGYFLAQTDRDFVILDGSDRVGDVWRKRWDSMELFTPAEYNNLPGMDFPAPVGHLPHKDEVADYLEAYAERFELPIRLQTWVKSVTREEDIYYVETAGGERLAAGNVVVATGAFQAPRVPAFAGKLNDTIVQLHSSEYRAPEQLRDGDVLVVGAGNSGTQIALEVARTHDVWLSGRDVGRLPRMLLGRDIYWWIWRTLLHIPTDSWLGRRLQAKATSGGDPLVGITQEEIQAAGIERVPRTVSVRKGRPSLADGRTIEVPNVIWATGFVPDYNWIDLPVFREDGYPRHRHGVVEGEPGLYFVGLRFQHRLKSSLIGGVGDDAEYVVEQIMTRAPAAETSTDPTARRREVAAQR